MVTAALLPADFPSSGVWWLATGAGVAAAAPVLSLAGIALLRRRLADAREQVSREQAAAAARGAEVAHLATVRAPAIAERVREGRGLDGIPGPALPAERTGEDFARALESVVAALGSDEAVRRERALRDSVQAAFESVARNMHAMATVQQQVLDHVERLIDNPVLMAEVMKADHAAAQMTRKAQTLLVMCGIWPTRRESRPVSLFDCVRGAQSRIVEFGRVEVHGGQNLYVVPPAVEGLMHATAELLENATVFSPSRTQVVVSVREVAAGAVVEIDDAGLGMPPDVLEHALGQLRNGLDLAELGAVPRLGLACVGRWSRELGFGVELTTASAYGGTRAVLFVPHRLLTEPVDAEPASTGAVAESPRTRPPEIASAPRTPDTPAAPALPVRNVGGAGATAGTTPETTPETATGNPIPTGWGTGSTTETDAGAGTGAGPDAKAEAGTDTVRTPAGLPRRRSRRRSPDAPHHRQPQPWERQYRAGTGETTGTVGRPAPRPTRPWSPESAAASVADIVSGTRRGRAELENPPQKNAPQNDEREEGR
nr:ATP-binding protein [Streptomyces taklimakanensis]